MKCTWHFLALSLAMAPLCASADDDWVTNQGISYRCGGIGDESLTELKSNAGTADAQLVLTAGQGGNYLSDVQLTVAGAKKQQSVSWQADGPVCLLKLPAGTSTVDASYGDEHRSVKLTKPARAGATKPVVINFKSE